MMSADLSCAEVAELVYALVSNTSGGNSMRVQIPPSAPSHLFSLFRTASLSSSRMASEAIQRAVFESISLIS